LKKPTVRLNVYNLFDKQYLNLNGGSGSQFTTNASGGQRHPGTDRRSTSVPRAPSPSP
jgi:iron complex outermembrane receptor protein